MPPPAPPRPPRTLQGWQARGCLVGVGLLVLFSAVVILLAVLSNLPHR